MGKYKCDHVWRVNSYHCFGRVHDTYKPVIFELLRANLFREHVDQRVAIEIEDSGTGTFTPNWICMYRANRYNLQNCIRVNKLRLFDFGNQTIVKESDVFFTLLSFQYFPKTLWVLIVVKAHII